MRELYRPIRMRQEKPAQTPFENDTFLAFFWNKVTR